MSESSANILVVEDSSVNQRLLQDLLQKQGYQVSIVANGREALDVLEDNLPDLILLDIVMPQMDGLELCRRLKAGKATRDIPVIFVSSLQGTRDKLLGFDAGGVDYITKPFQPREVVARVDTHLKLCRLQHQLEEQNRRLEEEKLKSETLLLNVLPVQVAKELIEKGHFTPQRYDNVSVCFVDIVQFTAAASLLEPEIVIAELNDIFTGFDCIVEKHDCERMKTVGDAYLCVCGFSEEKEDHAHNMATAALEMIDFLVRRNEHATHQWQVRIGIHTGSVVGGIVGTKKYLYDIFGDTVNIAARLEGLAPPMRVTVSEDVYRLLGQDFILSCSSEVAMKGKGRQAMYILERKQPG